MQDKTTIKFLPWFGIPKLWPYFRAYKKEMVIMFVTGAISTLSEIIFPLFNQYAINNFIGKRELNGIGMFVVLYFIAIVIQIIMQFISPYVASNIEISVARDLRNSSFNHLQSLSFSYFNQNNVGYIHARVMSDTGRIGEIAAWYFFDIMWSTVYIVGAFAVMFSLNAKLALAIAIILPIEAIIVSIFQKNLLHLNREVREINSAITGNFNEGITGAKEIKTLVAEGRMKENFDRDTLNMKRKSIRVAHFSALSSSLVSLASSVVIALVLMQASILSLEGVMLIGTLSVFMSYVQGIIEPISNVALTFADLIASSVNIERFTGLMATESDVADSKEVVEKYGDIFNPKKENWEELHGDIEFKNVTFKYPDGDEYVLENFNLKVPQGTNVAIVGETGAGKSTLVNLVCRFFEPTKGQVLIDGRDARERSGQWLHSNIGYVLQSPHLFSGTIRENLRYGKPDATDEEIMKALELVSATAVVEKMDKGLDSEVGEGGDLLSTGEKQLISFARAIIAEPKILVLDEATSSIDTVTEKIIQDAIEKVITGRTSFVIAHRLSTIVNADVILVVKDGKIIEQGKHKELMRQKGYYYGLFTRQFENSVVDEIG